jgi:uncharacterized protein YbjT (DUF2867 family)
MKTAVVAGAGGLIGTFLVEHLQKAHEFSKIILLVRKPLGLKGEKIKELIVDFEALTLLELNPAESIVFCCVGTTIGKAGSQEIFEKADYHLPVNLAHWCKKQNIPQLLVVSSLGADPLSSNFYLRTKGRMQQSISGIGLETVIFVQPSLLTGPRKEFRFGEKIAILSSYLWRWLLWGPFEKYRPIAAETVAKAMIKLSLIKQKGVHTVLSNQLQKASAI